MSELFEANSFLLKNLEIILFFSICTTIWFFFFHKTKRSEYRAIAKLQKAIEDKLHEPFSLHPEINHDLCSGCGGCTRVCPEGDILQLINNKAILVSPTNCVGHGECEVACPFGAISLVFGTKTRGMDIPRVNGNFETNVPGVYIAGELGGMGLIRNAIKQGTLAAEDAISSIQLDDATKKLAPTQYDLLIVGSGPAGIAAGLIAVREKMSYIILEQNSFGGTVYNYPRQKIVMSRPSDLPIIGEMKFTSNQVSKEELLKYWNKIRNQTGLQITEKCRFESFTKLPNNNFEVKTSLGLVTAKRIILSMGVRGSPRRLGLENEDLPKVTYSLENPDDYNENDIIVVGGGNAAAETAITLASPKLKNRVHLLVRDEFFDTCNSENRTALLEMKSKGLLKIWFKSSVQEIHPKYILVKSEHPLHQKTIKIHNDFLFVMAGAEVPFKFLQNLGVTIDRKFGEPLKSSLDL